MSTLKVNTVLSADTPTVNVTDGLNVTGVSTVTTLNTTNIVNATPLSHRNKVINGAMTVSQRNGTSAVTTVNAYNIDRWQNAFSGTIGAYSFSQSTDSPDGFANSYKIDVTTADTSLGSTDVHYFRTALEGQDVQDFAKGTSSAKEFTLSFYVKATKTGTYIVNLTDADNSRECSASYTVSNTNWNRYTVSFPADTTGAFDNDDNVSLRVLFALSAGSSFQSGTLSTSWAASTDANRLVGQVNLADNTSNDWLITGVQLEVGSVATPFEHRSYADQLVRCQRYFQTISRSSSTNSVDGTFAAGTCNDNASSGGILQVMVRFQTTMRAAPTMTQSGTFSHHVSGVNVADTTVAFNQAYIDGIKCTATQTAFVSADGSCGELISKYSDTSTTIMKATAEL